MSFMKCKITKMETQTYWIGPCGVLVPSHIKTVTAQDGVNTRYSNGCETEMYAGGTKLTLEQYRNMYAERRYDGLWVWKETSKK